MTDDMTPTGTPAEEPVAPPMLDEPTVQTPEPPARDEPVSQPAAEHPTIPAPPVPGPVTAPLEAPAQHPGVGRAVAWSILIAFIVAALAGALAGFAGARLALISGRSGQTTGTLVVAGQTDEPVAAAAAVALPSVVNIDVSGSATSSAGGILPKGHPSVPVSANGSGVAYKPTPDGGTYIITNDHVVAGATSIVVTGVDGDRHKATLVGKDPETDIAVVKVDAHIQTIKAGDSKKLVVGQMVIAIGSPFGLEHSVSDGVVSALHRSLPPSEAGTNSLTPLVDAIQTDAAINPGNSGGALVDRRGLLVGIPSAIFSNGGASEGVGFAIPVNSAAGIANQLIATGKAEHPFLGIAGQAVNDTLASQKKLPVTSGALVVQVFKGTGAEKAGLKPNDIITQLDATPIRSMDDLVRAVRNEPIGQKVTLKVYRDNKQLAVEMTVGAKPAILP